MRKNITFFILQVLVCLFFSEFAVKAQPGSLDWAMGIGGAGADAGNALALDSAGNVYIAGSFSGTASFDPGSTAGDVTVTGTGTDIFVAKYDNAGNFLWVKTMGGKLDDAAADITLDTAGNIYITGSYRDTADFNPGPAIAKLIATGGGDIFFAKYDNNGNYIYAKTLSGTTGAAVEIESGRAIRVDHLGNVFVGGQFRRGTVDFDPGPAQQLFTATGVTDDIFIAKYDSDGAYVWAFKIGGSGIDNLYGMSIDDTGNVYVTGQLTTGAAGSTLDLDPGPDPGNVISNGGSDIFMAKYNAGGHFVWAHALGSSLVDRGKSITVDAAGYIYITGEFQTGTGGAKLDPAGIAPNLTSKGNFDVFVAKYDNGGNYIWAINVGGKTDDLGTAITVDNAGDVIVTGCFTDTAYFDHGTNPAYLISKGGNDVFIARYDSNGQYIWTAGMGGSAADEGNAIGLDVTGQIFTTGIFTGIADFDPGPDTFTLTASTGSDIFLQKLHGTCHTQAALTITACDSFVLNGSVYTTTGIYVQTLPNANSNGCDSIMTLDLTITSVPASVSISASPRTTICSGTPVTFTPLPVNGGSSPAYEWRKNGTYAGSGATYTDNSLSDGDVIICRLTSSEVCATPDSALSNPITMTVNPLLVPSVSISADKGTTVCADTLVTFTATSVNGGATPVYKWYKNSVAAGTGAIFTDNALVNGDVITCHLTSSEVCAAPDTAVTELVMQIITHPTASVTASGSPDICEGEHVTLTADESGLAYQWNRNGNAIGGATSREYDAGEAGDYTVTVYAGPCMMTTDIPVRVTVRVRPLPIVFVKKDTLTVTEIYDDYQWYVNDQVIPGATNRQHIAIQNGVYYVLVTNAEGCEGTSALHPVNGVDVGLSSIAVQTDDIEIYPNPARNIVYIQAPFRADVAVYSMDGRMVIQKEYTDNIKIQHLSDGIYMICIKNKEGIVVRTERLIKGDINLSR